MERQVIFRDYQEQTAGDHNNLQGFVRESFDHLVKDTVSDGRQYSGFLVTKTGQAEVSVAAGQMYDQGVVAARRSSFSQPMSSYLAVVSQKIITVSVFAQENETDVQNRDYLVDVDTGETEPRAVSMTKSRDAVLAFTAGAEAADPQAPAIPATHVAVANILVDTTQVVSVTMLDASRVKSLSEHEQRLLQQEEFKDAIEPRVSSLASDISALAGEVSRRGSERDVSNILIDLARIKAQLELPADVSDYGADRFLDEEESDTADAAGLGYDAKIEEGIRFSDANADVSEIDLFSANDPNASLVSGMLLPKFTSVRKLSTGAFKDDIGIAQYGFQTNELVQKTITRQRVRYGSVYYPTTSHVWWRGAKGRFGGRVLNPILGIFQKAGETFADLVYKNGYFYRREDRVFVDTYEEPYWDYVTVDHSIEGAQVGQTFLISNDTWATRLGFYITTKAANEDIWVSLCEVTNGQPDLSKAVLVQSYPHASIAVGWNRMTIQPTFLKAGTRYALVFMSNANHRFGMADGQGYLDGTFFYSTDSAYFLGDLTRDLMIEVWGAKFDAAQVTIEFEALNLDGGIRAVDVLCGSFVPQSTQVIWEIQPNGSGAWIALDDVDTTALNTSPPLCRFRGRFVGTKDIHAGLQLTGSQVKLLRPKTTFKHVSDVITLATPSDDIYVRVVLENFDDTPHDLTAQLRVASTNEAADVTETVTIDADTGHYERTFRFQLGSAISSFRIVLNGSTNSAASTFQVSERVHWAV